MVKKISAVLVGVVLFAVSAGHAGLKDDIVKLVGDNATSYIHPLTNSMGVAMNSGWYNSSKSYKFLMLPVGIQVYLGLPVAMINDDLRTYDFNGEVQTANLGLSQQIIDTLSLPTKLTIKKPKVPTLVGDEDVVTVTMQELLLANGVSQANIDIAGGLGLNVNQPVFALPGGMKGVSDLSFMPFTIPSIGVNVGLPFKAQVGLRLFPGYKVPFVGKVSQFGLKFQYEFTDLIPVLDKLPLLHTSVHYAFNNADLFDILKLKNWTAMVNASADFKFVVGMGLYAGVGLQGSKMELNYTVPDDVVGLAGTKVNLEDKGDNTFVAQVGARFSIAIFNIILDGTFGKTTSYYLGVGVGLNGI